MTAIGLILLRLVPLATLCIVVLFSPIWIPYLLYERIRHHA